MKKSLHATLIYHQQILAEKTITSSKVTLGSAKNNDFTVDAADLSSSYTVFEKDVVRLRPQMLASLSSAGHLYPVGTPRHGTKSGEVETFEFTESDWLILNLSPGLDFVLCYKSDELPPFIPASPVLTLSQALESPVARALVLSFALHSAFILLTSLASDPEDAVHVKALETRWVELISEVSERQEEEKEDVPVIEDVDNVIETEKPDGVIVQFGGQTAIKLIKYLSEKGVKILGTSADDTDAAEDRDRFSALP